MSVASPALLFTSSSTFFFAWSSFFRRTRASFVPSSNFLRRVSRSSSERSSSPTSFSSSSTFFFAWSSFFRRTRASFVPSSNFLRRVSRSSSERSSSPTSFSSRLSASSYLTSFDSCAWVMGSLRLCDGLGHGADHPPARQQRLELVAGLKRGRRGDDVPLRERHGDAVAARQDRQRAERLQTAGEALQVPLAAVEREAHPLRDVAEQLLHPCCVLLDLDQRMEQPQPLVQAVERRDPVVEGGAHAVHELLGQGARALQDALSRFGKLLGRVGGGGGARIGDEVGDGPMVLVADGGDDGNFRGENRARHRLFVERPQILEAPPAPPHDEDVGEPPRLGD